MKKILSAFLLLLCLCLALTLFSCESGEETKLPDTALQSAKMKAEGNNFTLTVPNSTEIFSLSKDLKAAEGASIAVYADEARTKTITIANKSLKLEPGNNVFYITVSNGNATENYVATLYRRHMYTLTFADSGNVIVKQQVEETFTAAEPTEVPTRTGYTFAGWDYDFTLPVTENATVTAKWNANENTPYTVKHYQQNIENDDYTLFETEKLAGTSDASITPTVKAYAGFTAPTAQTATVATNGSLLVEYYYERNTYQVSFVANGGEAVAPVSLKYGAALPTTSRTGYTFGGWFDNAELTNEVLAMPAVNGALYAWWSEETKANQFTWSATETVASITGYIGSGASVCIPQYIGGMPITSIGEMAFENCTNLTSVTIPNSVTSIGVWAFSGCTALNYNLYNTGEYLGNTDNPYLLLMRGTGVSDIHADTKIIGESAFSGCIGLSSITIPNGVIGVGDWAFSYCSKLASITFNGTIAQWETVGKREKWNYQSPITQVVCFDGTINL